MEGRATGDLRSQVVANSKGAGAGSRGVSAGCSDAVMQGVSMSQPRPPRELSTGAKWRWGHNLTKVIHRLAQLKTGYAQG